jgi:hypothetical protein
VIILLLAPGPGKDHFGVRRILETNQESRVGSNEAHTSGGVGGAEPRPKVRLTRGKAPLLRSAALPAWLVVPRFVDRITRPARSSPETRADRKDSVRTNV